MLFGLHKFVLAGCRVYPTVLEAHSRSLAALHDKSLPPCTGLSYHCAYVQLFAPLSHVCSHHAESPTPECDCGVCCAVFCL